jgi:predicted acyltransferase
MTLCGMLATDILRANWSPSKRAGVLFAYGGGLLALGFAVEPWVPCIKHIFTLSFTAQAMGYSVIALAVLYVLTDILRMRRGTGVLLLYGQFALTAYMVSHFFRPAVKGVVDPVIQGIPHLLGKEHAAWMPLITAVATAIVLTAILAVRRKLKD